MATLESHINIKSIDKSDWKIYKFSQIAKSISERVEPTETELETYVGLEHLDSESIHIKRFGKREDVSGTKLRCYPGDVIFGRRRAYQRKAAIVDFDGFCSAHALVLRANPDVIDPELFPFFLHSDTFMHRSVDISVGSLSPTINWGTLKNEEFLLPPKDQQARLAELLWAADEMVESHHVLKSKLLGIRENVFSSRVAKFEGHTVPLSEVLILKNTRSLPPHKREKYVGLEHIASGEFTCHNYQNSSDVLAQCNIFNVGDLCYSKLRPYLDKAFIATFDGISTTELLIYDVAKGYSKEYILNHFHSKPFIEYVSSRGFGTQMPRVSHDIIGQYEIKQISSHDQQILVDAVKEIFESIKQIEETIDASKQLQNSLINQLF